MRPSFILLLVITTTVSGYAQQQHPPGSECTRHDTFPAQCNPFGSASQPQLIDNLCGLTGDATTDGDKAQDAVKNNLCASGAVHQVTGSALKGLQKGVDDTNLAYGNRHVHPELPPPPVDRENFFEKEKASGFGEGEKVFFVGYIIDASEGSPETVNCHCNGVQFNDVHLTLADHPLKLKKAAANASQDARKKITASNDAILCTSAFTAEVIPHLRPAALENRNLGALKGKKVVKITGQLFFDAAHHPCNGTKPGLEDPVRFTSWEVHPVYAIEVCTKNSVAKCPGNNPSVWKALQ